SLFPHIILLPLSPFPISSPFSSSLPPSLSLTVSLYLSRLSLPLQYNLAYSQLLSFQFKNSPPLQISQIYLASPRAFLPEYILCLFLALESHFTNNNIKSQMNKFQVFIEFLPPTIIVQFTNILQRPSSNPYDDHKAPILQ
ncbi:unnamed protein product, partial [Hymenolepis diminuta]